jgi:hypothetical protein
LEVPGALLMLYNAHARAIVGEAEITRTSCQNGIHYYWFDEFYCKGRFEKEQNVLGKETITYGYSIPVEDLSDCKWDSCKKYKDKEWDIKMCTELTEYYYWYPWCNFNSYYAIICLCVRVIIIWDSGGSTSLCRIFS